VGAFDVVHSAQIWLWAAPEAPASWHFLTIDGQAGEAIAAHEAMDRLGSGKRRGFGSVKVRARIGDSEWATSVFPSKPHAGYLLPVKAAIRKAQKLAAGDEVAVALDLL
jgi:hypothetical protein